jgi:hypothetical protein
MPDNLKQLLVVAVIGITVLQLAKPIMLRICSAEDYRRRCLVWIPGAEFLVVRAV